MSETRNTGDCDRSRRLDHERIATVLLALVAFFGTASLALAGYLAFRFYDLEARKARILATEELQAALLHDQSSHHAVQPHAIPEIGYALNPVLRQSSWMAADGELYPINSIGLRGAEIEPKAPGAQRIVVVGDSVVFGWKLAEEELFARALERAMAEIASADRPLEVVTVALPGWNLRSERAFLEHHLARLDPDTLVWSVVQNDLLDVSGVHPPGVLARYYSLQNGAEPFLPAFEDAEYRLPLPEVLRRWDAALAEIAAFRAEVEVPILLLGWYFSPPHLRHLLERAGLEDLPLVAVPPSLVEEDRWKVEPGDSHPSPWGTQQTARATAVALGTLGQSRSPDLPAALSAAVQTNTDDTLERFAETARAASSTVGLEDVYSGLVDNFPASYVGSEVGALAPGALFGVYQGHLRRRGYAVLRDPGAAGHLVMRFSTPQAERERPRQITVAVRNRAGAEQSAVALADAAQTEVTVELPRGSDYPLYEVIWELDGAECSSPVRCESGVFEGLELR